MADGKIIEIAGTTITENVSGNYDLFAQNIISNAGKTVHEDGAENGKTHGTPAEAPILDVEHIQAKCIVMFRPNNNYDGEFGFDWIRLGDTGLKGDNWYRTIIGKMVYKDTKDKKDFIGTFVYDSNEYSMLMRTFKNLVVPWKPKVRGNLFLYTIPVMTLLKGETAKLSLKVEIAEKPEKLIIRQRKEKETDPDYFSFNQTEVTLKDKKYDLPNFLHITCNESFDKDQHIDVVAVVGEEEKLAGTLRVVKNSKRFQRSVKILFVRIKTAEGISNISGEAERIKKYLKQAYIRCTVEYLDIDLTKDVDYNNEFKNGYEGFDNNFDIHDKIYEKIKKSRSGKGVIGNKYNSYYRVYFTKKIISIGDKYLLGAADNIPGESVIILDVAAVAKIKKLSLSSINNTVAHEVFHTMGLNHTFVGGSDFIFRQYHTDNVMDYSDSSTGDIKGVFTFKWQWSIVYDAVSARKK